MTHWAWSDVLVRIGVGVAAGGLAALTWQGGTIGVLLHILIRPAIGWLTQLRGPGLPTERAATAGSTHRLTRRTARFRDLTPFWRPGQEAGVALAGAARQPATSAGPSRAAAGYAAPARLLPPACLPPRTVSRAGAG
ncbi:hypothetical protein [Streptomyces pakalii]|uniref:Uncharacterized protein n=1 Tax=Streptomyces pakalii TaxID=3036494 RepID=A0ABT7DAA2_9ACTN|nr:hypothetical protein [Streptomyces pakalii]MDJ1641824.1 hypothetical protein [Streptomyces pakalii]